jgi:hypothetical protein
MNMGIYTRGLNKRQKGRLKDLVISIDDICDDNRAGFDDTQQCNIRFGRGYDGTVVSTKDHKKAYRQCKQRVRKKRRT